MNDLLNNPIELEKIPSSPIENPAPITEMPSEEETPPPPIDAVISVSVSQNKLEAILSIEPPMNGGTPPTLEGLKTALSDRKITYGVNTAQLEEIAQNPIYQKNIIIAIGDAPINGIDGTYTFGFQVEKNAKPKEKQDGSVDYHDLGIVENTEKGHILCTIMLPTDGTQGMSVTGESLLPVKGKAVPSFVGKNTELNEDGTAITATIDGQIEFDGKKINVSETLFIKKDVDNSTGDIKVPGNVVITGIVLPGFVVEAGGNIEIKGTVESATLKAGNNIILRSGITGSELNCAGDLVGRFIENCNIFVKGDVRAEYVMNSNIKCGKNLQIVGQIAKFVGGSCIVGQDMVVRTIGSASGVKTEVELGTDPAVIERQQDLVKQRSQIESQMHSLKSLISLFQQLEAAGRLTPEKKLVLDDALFSYRVSTALLGNGQQELAEINKSIQTKGYGKVICAGTIHPGTKVTIGTEKLLITNTLSNTSLYYLDGAIHQGSAY